MPPTEVPVDPEGSGNSEKPEIEKESNRRGRRFTLVAAGALLSVCGALLAYGSVGAGGDSEDGRGAAGGRSGTHATEVAYEVLGEGTADISYRAAGVEDLVRNARLPWRKTVRLPQGATPAVSVTLGEKGGRASCGLTVAGRHVQSSTVEGVFGRGTCAGESSGTPTPTRTDLQGTP
ncbi:hypothetical protein ACIRTB_10845 [Streptomyces sp. NPDC101158]|uniref:hypothetical protein n=1 Tax=Streptomyces sp. NPDC101158 TaxID=3366117 RepID=UPI0038009EC6